MCLISFSAEGAAPRAVPAEPSSCRHKRSGNLTTRTFRLRPRTTFERLPDGVLLFCELNQELHRLNESSAVLADRLRKGASIADLRSELSSRGVAEPATSRWAVSCLNELASLGLLEADCSQSRFGKIVEQIDVAGVRLLLRYSSDKIARSIIAPFSHLRSTGQSHCCTYEIEADGGFTFISENGEPPVVVGSSLAAVWLKGMILKQVLGSAQYSVALHAACVTRDESAILLVGAPGSGKTTLSLALADAGFRQEADDVTLVMATGEVRGVSLPPGVKEGSWQIFTRGREWTPELPVHLRTDGQTVRFLPVTSGRSKGLHRVAMIVKLRRSQDVKPQLRPVPASDAVADLLREARSPDGRCSSQIIHALAELVRRAACFEAAYSEAGDLLPLLSAVESR